MKIIRQQGLSLVELLVALALSGIVIAGIFQVFMSNRQAFNLTESLVRSQENGRFVIDVLTSNIRQAGNYGCVPEFDETANNIQRFGAAPQLNTVGFNSADGAAQPGLFDLPDTLELFVLEPQEAFVTAIAPPNIDVTGGDDWNPNDFFILSNCVVGDVFVAQAGTTDAVVVGPAALRYANYSIANEVSTVSKVNVIQFSLDPVTNTLLVDQNNVVNELVDGIENIQFRYGVDEDGDFTADYIEDIQNIPATDLNDIVAIEISVLTVSDTEVTSSPQTVRFNEQTLVAPDNRMRKVYRSTVSLRNRLK